MEVWLMGFRADVRRPATDLARILGVDEKVARRLVASVPVRLEHGIDRLSADRLRNLLFAVGAIVELRSAEGVELSVPPTARAPERTPVTFNPETYTPVSWGAAPSLPRRSGSAPAQRTSAPPYSASGPASGPAPGPQRGRTSGSLGALSAHQRTVMGGSSVRPRAGAPAQGDVWAESRTRESRKRIVKTVIGLAIVVAVGAALWVEYKKRQALSDGDAAGTAAGESL